MWMRDAVERDTFPTIKQLKTDPRFFPYRYGQALWAYVAGRWGDRAVVDVYRTSLRLGLDNAITRVLGETPDSLSEGLGGGEQGAVHAADRGTHQAAGRRTGGRGRRRQGRRSERRAGDQPRRQVRRVLLERRARCSASICTWPTRRPAGSSGSSASPVERSALRRAQLRQLQRAPGRPTASSSRSSCDETARTTIAILDVDDGEDRTPHQALPGVGAVTAVSWSPDGKTLALSGTGGRHQRPVRARPARGDRFAS